MKNALSTFALIGSGILLSACGENSSSSSSSIDISIPFKAVAGDQAIRCGETLTGLGNGASGIGTDVKIANFRMFVHDVKLITDQGIKIAVTLDDTQVSQNADIALLDFRDTADIDDVSIEICPQTNSNSTVENPNYNDTVTGSALVDSIDAISAIEFTLGVPFDLNHNNQAGANEPLRNPGLASGMTWSWQNGYKFVGFDVLPAGGITRPSDSEFSSNKWNIHLGSTGCSVSKIELSEGTKPKTCEAPNRPTITLPIGSIALDNTAVQVDYAALVANNNLVQDDGGATGCMSFIGDPECENVFRKLGLRWGDNDAVEQTVFSIIKRSNN